MKKREKFDAVVIGAGAAGLMCALRAGQRGKRVLLIDHAEEVGKKILISGGGRCNFTNLRTEAIHFFSNNPHFCKSALASYTPHDFITLVEKHKIPYHEKTLGQLFCDGSARNIVAMLLEECAAAGVDVRTGIQISDIVRGETFRVETAEVDFESAALVLATGGLSIPKMGATGFTHDIAKRFDVPLTEILPGLVPFTFEGEVLALMQALSGVSLEVITSAGKKTFREDMIFTHRGLSGPAVLQISSVWRAGQSIQLDLLPDLDAAKFLKDRKKARPNAELKTVLAEIMPQRLAESLATTYFTSPQIHTLTDKTLNEVAAVLKKWVLTPSGTEGYAKAEVTLGGVDTRALSSKTMQVSAVPGLFIIGEAVDVTGWLGGYNFQWAWASGWSAGNAV